MPDNGVELALACGVEGRNRAQSDSNVWLVRELDGAYAVLSRSV